MRTYTRKRPDYRVIEGVESLCRLCLEKPEEQVPIFTDATDVCATLAMRIMICVGLEMVRDSRLPNQICKECYKELEQYYAFRKKCEVTYQKLKSHILAYKEKEFNKISNEQKDDKSKNGIKPKTEVEVDGQHLVLMFNGSNAQDQLKVVNVIDINDVLQDNDNENNQKSTNAAELNVQKVPQEIDVQMQDVSTTNPELSTVNIETNGTDMSTLLSAMLLELGILTQQDDNLIVNQNINTLELEGGDGSSITLELVEEDEVNILENPTLQDKVILAEEEKNDKPKFSYSNDKDSRGTKEARCAECGRGFSSRSVLARHARVHSGERPFACRRCGRAFAQRAVLARHELVHAERRPFACAHCPKSFTQRGALDAHARRHAPHALMLHRCARCPKLFLHASGLSRHMTVVHNGRLYVCGGCGRQFRDKSALLRHMRNANHEPAATETRS